MAFDAIKSAVEHREGSVRSGAVGVVHLVGRETDRKPATVVSEAEQAGEPSSFSSTSVENHAASR